MSERSGGDSPAAAVLLEKGGKFYFYQPGTSVIASDANVETAYGKFLQARREFQEQVDAAGLTLGGPSAPTTIEARIGGRSTAGELTLFLAKACIVLVIVGGILAAVAERAATGIAAAIDNSLRPVSTISLADVSHKAAEIVKDIHSLTKEDRESLRQSLATISREIEPYADAWRNPPAAPQPSNPEPAKSNGR
jgi:hypothetical protein